ncbi:HAD-IIIC family phosphatase [Paenibacillus elgii]|uniref:HAD-IIIC family phosphatase n=1 Tax=Paenibacillus elgii TaxID=189691 RepID=UPI000248C3EE|nr:HAD-IIIC family phosphatase [Paenibacillus elgii]
MRIAVLSNITVDSLIRSLDKTNEVYLNEGYGMWVQELTNPDSSFHTFQSDCTFLLLDGDELVGNSLIYEDVISEMDKYIGYIKGYLNKNPDRILFVSNLDIPLRRIQSVKEDRLERKLEYYWLERLSELNKLHERLFIYDLKQIVEEIGRSQFYSAKMWYLGGMKFSRAAEAAILKEMLLMIKALQGNKKKCIVIDLDNTLWGGVVGEDGIKGIELSDFKEGARYKDFQKRLKEINDLGIILAVASKNNLSDVLEVFRQHKQMILSEENFVSMKVNWKDKFENITELIDELNIGPDSMVFIDDNPIERGQMKAAISEVEVPEFPVDTSKLEGFITEIYKTHFVTISVSSEDKKKTEMYRGNAERKKDLQQAGSLEQFLSNLNMKITIWQAQHADVPRIVQLVQKTNQFNLTTKRYTESDLIEFITSAEYTVYVFALCDKFGDNGTVGMIILKHIDHECVEIDSFLMSCRVMGRKVEEQVIEFVEKTFKSNGYTFLKATYMKTQKNNPVEKLFDVLNYELYRIDDAGNKYYKLALKELPPLARSSYAEMRIV